MLYTLPKNIKNILLAIILYLSYYLLNTLLQYFYPFPIIGATLYLSCCFLITNIIIKKYHLKLFTLKPLLNKMSFIPLLIIVIYILVGNISLYITKSPLSNLNIPAFLLFFLIIKCIFVAIIEEALCREIFPNMLSKRLSPFNVMIISSLIFSLGHISEYGISRLIFTFLIGIVFFQLKQIGNLHTCILFHFFWNITVIFIDLDLITTSIFTFLLIPILFLINKKFNIQGDTNEI